jgi:dTDP-4-dehydrorhamnose reductase
MDHNHKFSRILVTGSGGQLGSELCRQLGSRAIPIDVDGMDITSQADVQRVLSNLQPDCVVNSAAYTAVDKAESDAERCFRVNVTGVSHLAIATAALNARLIQISTDYVFGHPNHENRPWTESDEPAPRGVYAISKREGELAAAANPNHLVIRSCGLYGKPGPTATGNFVTTMLRLGRERPVVRVVSDQYCTPTWVVELARAVIHLIDAQALGMMHVVNGGSTTWFQFAREIFQIAELRCHVEPITTAQYGAVAPRPTFSVLDCSQYQQQGGPLMSTWQDAVCQYIHSL